MNAKELLEKRIKSNLGITKHYQVVKVIDSTSKIEDKSKLELFL